MNSLGAASERKQRLLVADVLGHVRRRAYGGVNILRRLTRRDAAPSDPRLVSHVAAQFPPAVHRAPRLRPRVGARGLATVRVGRAGRALAPPATRAQRRLLPTRMRRSPPLRLPFAREISTTQPARSGVPPVELALSMSVRERRERPILPVPLPSLASPDAPPRHQREPPVQVHSRLARSPAARWQALQQRRPAPRAVAIGVVHGRRAERRVH